MISNCVEDAVTLADYVRSPNFCCQYCTDPESIYLIGHSMGGCTALNAVRQLPWLRGLVLLTPFDPTRHLLDGEEETLRRLLEQGKTLHSGGTEALLQNIKTHLDTLCFETAYEALRDQNLLCITGTSDQCAPADKMFLPLWNRLQAHKSKTVQRFLELPAGHGLLGCRVALIHAAAQFLIDTLQD